MDQKIFCPQCGSPVNVYGRFCSDCGAKIPISPSLVRLAAEGDDRAMDELYERAYRDVYRAIKIIIKNEDTVLDILQDSFLKGFQNLDQLKDGGSYLPWMKRIAVNNAKNELKRKKPILFTDMENEDGDELPFEDEREENLPEVVLDKQETSRMLQEILDGLSNEQRLVVELHYFQDIPIKHIAAELGCSENTIKSQLRYARKKIEVKVLELEKQGTKLYSLSPVLFLLLLYRNWSTQPVDIPADQILANIRRSLHAAQAAADGAGTAAGKAAQTAAGEAVKQGLLSTIGGKILIGVAAVALIGGITVGAVQLGGQLTPAEPPAVSEEEPEDEPAPEAEQAPEEPPNEPEPLTVEEQAELAEEALAAYLESELIPREGIFTTDQSGQRKWPESEGIPAGPAWFDGSGIYAVDDYDYDGDGLPEMLIVRGNDRSGVTLDLYDSDGTSVELRSTAELNNVVFDGYQGAVSPVVLWRQDVGGTPHLLFWYDDDVYRTDASANRYVYLLSAADGELQYEYSIHADLSMTYGYRLTEYSYTDGVEQQSGTKEEFGTAEAQQVTTPDQNLDIDYYPILSKPLSEKGVTVNSSFDLTGENAFLIFRHGYSLSGDSASADFTDNTAFHETYSGAETATRQTEQTAED